MTMRNKNNAGKLIKYPLKSIQYFLKELLKLIINSFVLQKEHQPALQAMANNPYNNSLMKSIVIREEASDTKRF